MSSLWLPLNGDLHNQGISGIIATGINISVNTAGKIGSCYSFNGSSSYIELNSALCSNETTEFSYTCWVKFYSTASCCLFSNRTATNSNGVTLFVNNSGNILYDIGNERHTKTYSFSTDTWYHLAFTYKKGTTKKIYVNGAEIYSVGTSGAMTGAAATKSFIGASQNTSTTVNANYLNGYLNDVRIWNNHCLSAAEVREIAQGLVLHYKLDSRGPSLGNPNLLINSTVPTAGNGASGIVKSITEDGLQKVVADTSNGNWVTFSNHNTTLALSKGDTFTFSLKIKSDNSIKKPTIYFQSGMGYFSMQGIMGSNWSIIYYTGTWNIDNLQTNIHLGFSSAPGTYYIEYFKLEKGNSYTSWAPAAGEYLSDLNYIEDSSGYNHNGSILNDVLISSDTPRYSTSTNLIAGNSAINCGRGGMVTDSITVNIWLKSSAWGNPISCTEGGGWNFESNGDGFRFPVYLAGVGYKATGVTTTTRAQLCNNQWHMITGVYDRLNQKIRVYIDANLEYEENTSSSALIGYHGSNVIWIGAEASGSATAIGSNGMAGLFSDFRIYCTPLLDTDIKQLYNVGMKIDKLGSAHSFEFIEQQSNMIFPIELSRSNLEFINGLSRYTQSNCQVTLTDQGYHIYRPPNLTTANDGNTMWGGLKLVNQKTDTIAAYDSNRDNNWGLQKGHTYFAAFHAKGKSSNSTSWGWANNMGWSGGGVNASPTIITNIGIPSDFQGEKDCIFIFTINDDIAKNCTSAYSSYVANTTYLSYRHLTFGWGYSSTGTLGTDLYLTDLRLYDITNYMAKITRQGQAKFYDFVEQLNKAQIRRNSEFLSSNFIER